MGERGERERERAGKRKKERGWVQERGGMI